MKSIQGSFIKRALMVGLIAGSGALAASSFAMPGNGPEKNAGCEARQVENAAAKSEGKWEENRARALAMLKEKLKLQPEQEAAWNKFTSTGQFGPGQKRLDKQAMRSEMQQLNTPQRLDKMQAMAEQRQARMLERSQLIKDFYAQLTPEQQSVFDEKGMRQGHHGQGHRHGSGNAQRQS